MRLRPWRGRYVGLSANDGSLLAVWLMQLAVKPDELHTHVPIGELPFEPSDMDDPFTRSCIEAAWPRRIDVAMRYGDEWWLIECKPDADHHALGQILCYRFWWERDVTDKPLARTIVLTDRVDPDCETAFAHYDVELVEVGDMFDRTRRRVRVVIGE